MPILIEHEGFTTRIVLNNTVHDVLHINVNCIEHFTFFFFFFSSATAVVQRIVHEIITSSAKFII